MSNHTEKLSIISKPCLEAIGYLTLISMANRYINTSERKLAQEIGKVSMDILEPEFSNLDKKNLIEKKKYLEYEYNNIQKLKLMDEYEEKFISNGKEAAEKLGFSAISLLDIGVPFNTLRAAKIL